MQCSYDAEKHFIQMLMPEKDRNYMLFHDLLKLYFNATINELAKRHFLNNQNNDPYCENYIDTGIPYTKSMR